MAEHNDKIAETLDLTPMEPKTGEIVKAEPAEDKKLDGKLFRKYLSEALTSKSIDRKTYRRLMTQFNNAQRKVKRNKR